MSDAITSAALPCPVCSMENSADAVFCGNPACHKALGEFTYVAEQISSTTTRLEKAADQVARFSAHPHFVSLHIAWFVVWIVLNSGAVGFVMAFDTFPFSLLGILLAIEAILITGFLLISQARQSRYAELRAELDYEVNVRSYRKLQQLETTLGALANRLDSLAAKSDIREG